MDTAKETSGASDKPRRVIKRYSNRKLYDTKDSRYVTLQQIGEMVRAGEEVQIIDNATKEDKTEVTLALIISEDLKSKPRSVPLGTLRDLIQERGERLLTQLREGPIGRLIPGVAADGTQAAEGAPTPPSQPPAAVTRARGGPDGPEAPVAHARAGPDGPGAPAAVPPPTSPPEADKPASKGRLSEIVESSKHTLDQWQHTLDERIRTIVPGVGLIRDLQAEVRRLTQRVDELEDRLRKSDGGPSKGSSG